MGKVLETITCDDYTRSDHYKRRVDDRHNLLWQVCRDTEGYKTGTDTNDHSKPDCSCGCMFFHILAGINGGDWGVCCCPQSPRAGLLTFEHMGCLCWARDDNL